MCAPKGTPYVSVGFPTDELVFKLCVRRQVHRCAPHGVIGRIQRDLYRPTVHQCCHLSINDRAHAPRWTGSNYQSAANCPPQGHSTHADISIMILSPAGSIKEQAKPKSLASHLTERSCHVYRKYDRHQLRRCWGWHSNTHRTRMHSDGLSRTNGDSQATTIPDRESTKKKPTRDM